MQVLDQAPGYATVKNAERKLRKVLGDNFDSTRWVMTVNAEGRFVPAVVGAENFHYIHNGLAILG